MKSKSKSDTYTATPASLFLPMSPQPTELKRPRDKDAPLTYREAKSQVTSIDEANNRTQDMLRECKRRFANNDPTGIATLLEDHPDLMDDPWVRDTYYKLVRAGRLRRPRGRRRGTFTVHPLVLLGLVEVAIKSGEVANPEKAFDLLDKCGWCPYETAKKLYYQAKNEPRFKAVFVPQTDKTRPASDAEIAGLTKVEVLRSGSTVRRTISVVKNRITPKSLNA